MLLRNQENSMHIAILHKLTRSLTYTYRKCMQAALIAVGQETFSNCNAKMYVSLYVKYFLKAFSYVSEYSYAEMKNVCKCNNTQ